MQPVQSVVKLITVKSRLVEKTPCVTHAGVYQEFINYYYLH